MRSNSVSLRIPQLKQYKIEDILCKSDQGEERKIEPSGNRYRIESVGLVGRRITLEFYHKTLIEESEPVEDQDILELEEEEEETAEYTNITEFEDSKLQKENQFTFKKKKKNGEKHHPTKSPWDIGQRKYKKQIELKARRAAINNPSNLFIKHIKGKRILTFGNPNCWARGLGMINKANQLREQVGVELHHYYDLVTGQGYGAIIAASIAAGVDLDRLMIWWTDDFKKVHTPTMLNYTVRVVTEFLIPSDSGFNHKKAVQSLERLFSKAHSEIRLRDVQTELQIKVIFADLMVSTYSSLDKQQQELTLAEITTDAAITKNDFNSKSTIKGQPPFLGEVEKNDVLGLLLSPDAKELEITCIDTPVRIDPENAPALENKSDLAMRVVKNAQSQHIYQIRVDQIAKKLIEQGSDIKLLTLQCDSIDYIVRNSTTRYAQGAGVESGAGKISLPDWFTTYNQKIAG